MCLDAFRGSRIGLITCESGRGMAQTSCVIPHRPMTASGPLRHHRAIAPGPLKHIQRARIVLHSDDRPAGPRGRQARRPRARATAYGFFGGRLAATLRRRGRRRGRFARHKTQFSAAAKPATPTEHVAKGCLRGSTCRRPAGPRPTQTGPGALVAAVGPALFRCAPCSGSGRGIRLQGRTGLRGPFKALRNDPALAEKVRGTSSASLHEPRPPTRGRALRSTREEPDRRPPPRTEGRERPSPGRPGRDG